MVRRECPNEKCKTKHFKICITDDGHDPDSTGDGNKDAGGRKQGRS